MPLAEKSGGRRGLFGKKVGKAPAAPQMAALPAPPRDDGVSISGSHSKPPPPPRPDAAAEVAAAQGRDQASAQLALVLVTASDGDGDRDLYRPAIARR